MALGAIRAGLRPHGIAIDAVRNFLYVGNHEGGNVSVIDGFTSILMQTLPGGGALGANGVVYDPWRDRILVANKFTDDLIALSPIAPGLIADVPVGSQPNGIALDAGRHRLFVANFSDGTLSLIDTETLTELRRTPLGSTPSHVVFDPISGHAFVTLHIAHSLAEVDGEGRLVKVWPLPGLGPYGVTIDVAGRRVFVANRLNHSISRLHLDTGASVRLPMPCSTRLVAYNSNTARLWAVCDATRTLYLLDPNSGQTLLTFPLGNDPGEGIAINLATNRVYVSNAGDDTISMFQEAGPVSTPTPAPTRTPTPSPSITPTATASPTRTPTATATPTVTATPSPTPSPTSTATTTPSPTPSPTPTATATCAPFPDRYEPDDSPASASDIISGGDLQKRNFHTPTDQDWLRLQAAQGRYYHAFTDLIGSEDVDTLLELYAGDGVTLLAANDDIGPDNRGSAILFQAAQSGDHYLRVLNTRGIGSCFTFYSIRVAETTPTPTPTVTPTFTPTPSTTPTATVTPTPTPKPTLTPTPTTTATPSPTPTATPWPYDLYLPLYLHGNKPRVYSLLPLAPAVKLGRQQQPEPAPAALAIDPISGQIALAQPYRLTLLGADGVTQRRVAIGPRPTALVYAGGDLYLSDAGLGQVWRIDPVQGQIRGRSAAFGALGGLIPLEDGVIVAATAGDELLRLDAALTLRSRHPTGPAPYALARQGQVVAVAHAGSDTISLHQAQALDQARQVILGGLGHPQALAFNAAGDRLYVLFLYTPKFHRVAEIDVASGAVLGLLGGDYQRPLHGAYSLIVAGNLLLLPEQGQVQRYDLTTRRWLAPAPQAAATTPFGLALDGAGRLWLAPLQPGESAIEVLTPEHLFDTHAPPSL